ncbi:hypothetical protein [Lactobacillus sp. ESL0677]|uniref:hypothetical protein n=1 Tax=Lactobacillus sp. ESL0677 TaxID=2983208 RepID=UPI0023F8E049|nr:hypothetical protein [Lactobacillus sp. ESL0677]WEV36743.1 hypothetical protein OZX76_08395 [Lactobacillus sp. ESL0677]
MAEYVVAQYDAHYFAQSYREMLENSKRGMINFFPITKDELVKEAANIDLRLSNYKSVKLGQIISEFDGHDYPSATALTQAYVRWTGLGKTDFDLEAK